MTLPAGGDAAVPGPPAPPPAPASSRRGPPNDVVGLSPTPNGFKPPPNQLPQPLSPPATHAFFGGMPVITGMPSYAKPAASMTGASLHASMGSGMNVASMMGSGSAMGSGSGSGSGSVASLGGGASVAPHASPLPAAGRPSATRSPRPPSPRSVVSLGSQITVPAGHTASPSVPAATSATRGAEPASSQATRSPTPAAAASGSPLPPAAGQAALPRRKTQRIEFGSLLADLDSALLTAPDSAPSSKASSLPHLGDPPGPVSSPEPPLSASLSAPASAAATTATSTRPPGRGRVAFGALADAVPVQIIDESEALAVLPPAAVVPAPRNGGILKPAPPDPPAEAMYAPYMGSEFGSDAEDDDGDAHLACFAALDSEEGSQSDASASADQDETATSASEDSDASESESDSASDSASDDPPAAAKVYRSSHRAALERRDPHRPGEIGSNSNSESESESESENRPLQHHATVRRDGLPTTPRASHVRSPPPPTAAHRHVASSTYPSPATRAASRSAATTSTTPIAGDALAVPSSTAAAVGAPGIQPAVRTSSRAHRDLKPHALAHARPEDAAAPGASAASKHRTPHSDSRKERRYIKMTTDLSQPRSATHYAGLRADADADADPDETTDPTQDQPLYLLAKQRRPPAEAVARSTHLGPDVEKMNKMSRVHHVPVKPKGTSDVGVMEDVTLDDYEDWDGLLDVLDVYIRKNRMSRALGASQDGRGSERTTPATASPVTLTATAAAPPTSVNPTPAATSSSSRDKKMDLVLNRLHEANVKKITARIYIGDIHTYATAVLTSLMSTTQVIGDILATQGIENDGTWTLFELCHDLNIERPLRDWEIVTDILSAWSGVQARHNALFVKRYPAFRDTLNINSLRIHTQMPKPQGWLYLELRPGKFSRRFCMLKDGNLCYHPDTKSSQFVVHCGLANFDIYTWLGSGEDKKRKPQWPTPFGFALRSTDRLDMFENKGDYCRWVGVEKQERLYDWVLSIRIAKSIKTYRHFPEMFEEYADLLPPPSPHARKTKLGPGAVSAGASRPAGEPLLKLPESPPASAVKGGLVRRDTKAKVRDPVAHLADGVAKLSTHAPPKPLLSFNGVNGQLVETSQLDYARSRSDMQRAATQSAIAAALQGKGTLVDVSGINNCKSCGCSEFYQSRSNRDGYCAFCYHFHDAERTAS